MAKRCAVAMVLIVALTCPAVLAQSAYLEAGQSGLGGTVTYQKADGTNGYCFAAVASLGGTVDLTAFGGKSNNDDAATADVTFGGVSVTWLSAVPDQESLNIRAGFRFGTQNNRRSELDNSWSISAGIPVYLRLPLSETAFAMPYVFGSYSMGLGHYGRNTGRLQAGVSFCAHPSPDNRLIITPGLAVDKDHVAIQVSLSLVFRMSDGTAEGSW